MGDPSPRLRETGGAAAGAARVPLTPLRLPSNAAARACRCPTVAASTVSARCVCQRCGSSARPGSERPRPRLQRHAPRLDVIEYRGVPPVAARPQESAPQPPRRLLSEPPSDSMWPIVPSAGRLPARHRGDRDTALDCAFRRPRRLQPTTLPVAALWMAAPYHAVTRASRAIFLAIPLPPLAARPLVPPVTTPFAPICTPSLAGAVTGGNRAEPPPSPRRPKAVRGASRRPRACARGPRGSRAGALSAPSAGGWRAHSPCSPATHRGAARCTSCSARGRRARRLRARARRRRASRGRRGCRPRGCGSTASCARSRGAPPR